MNVLTKIRNKLISLMYTGSDSDYPVLEYDINKNLIYRKSRCIERGPLYEEEEEWEYDDQGHETYYKHSKGVLRGVKREKSFPVLTYNEDGYVISRLYSSGKWERYERDHNGQITLYENHNGYWYSMIYDDKGQEFYFNDCNDNGQYRQEN